MSISKHLNLRLGLDILFAFLLVLGFFAFNSKNSMSSIISFIRSERIRSEDAQHSVEIDEKDSNIVNKILQFEKQKHKVVEKIEKNWVDFLTKVFKDSFWIVLVLVFLSIFLISNFTLRVLTSLVFLAQFIGIVETPFGHSSSIINYTINNNIVILEGWEFCNSAVLTRAFTYLHFLIILFCIFLILRPLVVKVGYLAYRKIKNR